MARSRKGGPTKQAIRKWKAEQGYTCYYTGRKLTYRKATIDHAQPLSRRGRHEWANLRLCDKAVNEAKGAMTEAEFIDMCREVVRQHGAS